MDWTEHNSGMRDKLRVLNGTIPETAKGFGLLSKAAKSEDALDEKTKELVALGIAVSLRCEPCIGFHVEALLRCGATRDEVAGTLEMAIQMGGGPGLMYAAKALDAYDQLA